MIEVREVKTKKEQKEFLNFPLDLYDNNISAVMGGHFSTEIVVVKPLVEALRKMLPEIEFVNALQTAVAEVL